MPNELSKTYQPREVEAAIYAQWEKGGCFAPAPTGGKGPYTIVIPPPNVTGQLHLGHAFDNTLQDALIRYKRMDGYETLWMPGTDHAGIATQIKVEENLRANGVSRHELGREAFIDRVWAWKEKYGNRIVEQLKKLGASCDWDRLRFTMDDGLSRAVREVFVSLYEKGLIYRGYRITNICVSCQTALSETEVEYEEREGHLYHVKYGDLVVATTRPETMLGDTAVAVHPDDERYKHLIGKTVLLPLMDREIPIIADEYVEQEFGTGCVKITPCHDPNDFEVAKRHNLPELLIMGPDGVINANGGKYAGLAREEARKTVLKDLEKGGYLVKTEPHVHNVGACSRCHLPVEPMASEQWFVSMKELAAPAIAAVKEGRTRFVPERFEKLYLHWIENVRDWCVSRQIWWGHRIPVWTCQRDAGPHSRSGGDGGCGHIIVSRTDPTECPKCKGKTLVQDPDVLDTWFSSALWPFSTLGWPDETADLRHFYPTDVLVTGYDIIYLWVARMIFSGIEHTGVEPFHTVYMHGLLRDNEGKKMSKSAGNGVDPLEMVEQYGADALRLYITSLATLQGGDMRFVPERCEHFRNFCNKLWNASRFVLSNLGDTAEWTLPESLTLPDMWILTRLQDVIYDVTGHLDRYELNLAAQKTLGFIWDDFCDWYIELAKLQLRDAGASSDRPRAHAVRPYSTAETTRQILAYVLEATLRILHPFAPFITEEIYQSLPGGVKEGDMLITARWPEQEHRLSFKHEAAQMELMMDAIRAVRTRRSEMKVPPSKKAAWTVDTPHAGLFGGHADIFAALAGASKLSFSTPPEGAVQVISSGATIYLPLDELVDQQAEQARLAKERAAAEGEIALLEAKLCNTGFTEKAPERVVAAERERLRVLKERWL